MGGPVAYCAATGPSGVTRLMKGRDSHGRCGIRASGRRRFARPPSARGRFVRTDPAHGPARGPRPRHGHPAAARRAVRCSVRASCSDHTAGSPGAAHRGRALCMRSRAGSARALPARHRLRCLWSHRMRRVPAPWWAHPPDATEARPRRLNHVTPYCARPSRMEGPGAVVFRGPSRLRMAAQRWAFG
jgi:hypothetical protein